MSGPEFTNDIKAALASCEKATIEAVEAAYELRRAKDDARDARMHETAALNRHNNAVKAVEAARQALDAAIKKEIPL